VAIEPGELGCFVGEHRGATGRLIDQSHFTDDASGLGIFDDLAIHHHIHRTFEHDEHAVRRISGAEERFTRREMHGIGLVRKQFDWVHPGGYPIRCLRQAANLIWCDSGQSRAVD